MIWFALASLSPLLLSSIAAAFGGVWAFLALTYMTLCVFLLDRSGQRLQASNDTHPRNMADLLSVVLALGHLGLLVYCLQAVPDLPLLSAVIVTMTLGLFMGQVSHPNAHELIHHGNRWMRRLGVLVYSSMLIGHHVSAHLRVHHVHVGTARDPNSAPLGEGFYRFWRRAWVGSFRQGLIADNRARERRSRQPGLLGHPYLAYVGIALGMLVLAAGLAGPNGVLVLLAGCGYSQMQIFLADYVQHYGLRRPASETGKPVPVGPGHAWNAPHWYSSALMLNAPRHSDHHLNPKRRFPDLQLNADMPTLPHSLPVMAVLALLPPIWRRVMDSRAARWAARQEEGN